MVHLKMAPSFMSADLLNVQAELEALDPYADYYHVDIIDWHYVRNMCLTPQFIQAMSAATKIPIEAHLYVDGIDEELINLCIDSGASLITLPADGVARSVNRFASLIHSRGAKIGIFLNPAQRVEEIVPYIDVIDSVLLMSVDPGFGGQNFNPLTYSRASDVRDLREHHFASFQIAVDGNCNETRFLELARAGVDAFSLGRGLFGRSDDTATAARLTRESLDAVEREIDQSAR